MTRAECTQHCSVTDHTDQEGKLPLALLLSMKPYIQVQDTSTNTVSGYYENMSGYFV